MSENILLMWDDFSGHWTKEVRDYAASINIVLLKIPAGYIRLPADRHDVDEAIETATMEEQLLAHRRGDVPTSFKLLAPKRRAVIDWLHSSWVELSIEAISNGFKKLMIALGTDEALCQEEPAPQDNVIALVATLTELNVTEDVGYDLEEASNTEE